MAKWPSFVAMVDLLQKQTSGLDRLHVLAGLRCPSRKHHKIERHCGLMEFHSLCTQMKGMFKPFRIKIPMNLDTILFPPRATT